MIRKAFKMSVHEDQHGEYARRHDPIWRELEDTLLAHGVRSYSIYLDPATSELFAYAEIDSEERWAAVASTDVCKRWWRHMRSSCRRTRTTARSRPSCERCSTSSADRERQPVPCSSTVTTWERRPRNALRG